MFFFIKPLKGKGLLIEPADNISSIFTARRDLLLAAKQVVAGSGLTVDEADLLVSLYGARELGWDDMPHDDEGYMTFSDLELHLVHNSSLLSRRVRKLATQKPPLVEIAAVDTLKSGLHFNSQRVRITPAGVKRIAPVWERYREMSAKALKDIPQKMLDDHYMVNSEISARIRARQARATDFLAPD